MRLRRRTRPAPVRVRAPRTRAKATDRRAAADFAQCMRELSDVHFPEPEQIRVVMDNLSTRSAASLEKARNKMARAYPDHPPDDATKDSDPL
jgi:hypothetical protein